MAYFDDTGEILCACCELRPATGVVCQGEDDTPDYREIWHCDDCWEKREAKVLYMLRGSEKDRLAMQIEDEGLKRAMQAEDES